MALGTALGGAGLGLGVIGTALQVQAAQSAGQAADRQARFNAGVADREAGIQSDLLVRDAQVQEQAAANEREARAFDERNLRRQERHRQGAEDVRIAASGIRAAGSTLQVMIENAHEAELAIEAATFPSRQRETALRDEATLSRFQAAEVREAGRLGLHIGRFQGDLAKQRGRSRATAAALSGGAQLLSGGAALSRE